MLPGPPSFLLQVNERSWKRTGAGSGEGLMLTSKRSRSVR